MTAGKRVGGTTGARKWDGGRVQTSRRRVRLAPGVIALCLVMTLGTFVTVFASAPALASSPHASPDCMPCPGGGCEPNCGGGGGTAPSLSNEKVGWWVTNNIARQVNISWSFAGTGPITGSFSWHISGGASQPVPTFSNGFIRLNALQAGTTYDFTIGESNSWGQASYQGSFSPGNAPANEFVGWVSQLVSNPSELDQIGNALGGANVWISANCPVYGDTGGVLTSTGGDVAFPAIQTSSSGAYTYVFPEALPSYVEVGFTVFTNLTAAGVCTSQLVNVYHQRDGGASISDSSWSLWAAKRGYWNATLWVSSTLSVSNDDREFGLPTDGYSLSPVGVGYSHTSDAGCTIGVTDGESQQVQNYVNILGYQSGYTATGTVVDGTTASAVFGGESNIALDYQTSGVVNETPGNVVFGEAQAYGAGYDLSTDTASFPDPDSSPPAFGNTTTSSTFERTVGPDSTQWTNDSNGGSYTSTSGFDLQVDMSGGWDGESFGGGVSANLIQLVDLTSAGADTSHAVDCTLHDTSTTYAYQFIISMDGTQSDQTQAQVINAHIWFDDECLPGASGCP